MAIRLSLSVMERAVDTSPKVILNPLRRAIPWVLPLLGLLGLTSGTPSSAWAQASEARVRETLPKSLHSTGAGMELWYSEAQGGLETITHIPYRELGCSRCHVAGCENCHGEEGETRNFTSPSQTVCLGCHFVENVEVRRLTRDQGTADVHFSAGMECLDCHTLDEVHGDGARHTSFQASGVLAAECTGCHESLSTTLSHSVHGEKLDCTPCHVRSVPTCYNCHFGETGSGPSVAMDGLVFLLNQDGQVTAANLHTFVFQDRALITFAPFFPHTVMAEGRGCGECHGTEAALAVQSGAFSPVVHGENGPVARPGVIPVAQGVEWSFPLYRNQEEAWVPFTPSQAPRVNIAGFGAPLSSDQIRKLALVPETAGGGGS